MEPAEMESAADAGPAQERRIAPDEAWWPAVARLVREHAAAGAAGARDLRHVLVLLPGLHLAPALRAALHREFSGAALFAPRLATLESWAGVPAGAALAQRADLFAALRASAWVRERYSAQPGALWALARDLAQLGDELTLAASGAAAAFEGRWRGAVQRVFAQRAAAAADPQTQLVLQLWRAGLEAGTGASALPARLEALARAASGPLIWLLPQGAAPWQRAYGRAYARLGGHAAVLVSGDMAALAARHPWIGAAWPELAAPLPVPPARVELEPLAERARALSQALRQGAAPAAAPLRILRCASLEEEAGAAARWTLERLRGGATSVALVALDRLTARRVRALLDRAGVLLADESGWKLSTTSAAAAVMRWLDLAIGGFAAADLLDWLHSPFTLAGRPQKPALVAAVQAALAAGGVVSGRQAVLDALAKGALAAAQQSVRELAERARAWQSGGTLGRWLGLLAADLELLGMRAALGADPVGAAVLAALDELRAALVASTLALGAEEFRALLAEHFEQAALGQGAAGGARVDSPVLMTTLAGTRLRRFDAALLIGADADRLPGRRAAGGLMAAGVRRELGLRTDLEREREQAQDLAALLALVPAVAATWRCRRKDEPQPLSPLLDRLATLARLAGAPDPLCLPADEPLQAVAAVSPMRAPQAPDLLPARLSASAAQDLVDCPYRFFALRMLGLRAADRPEERAQKRDLGSLLHAALLAYHRGAAAGADGEARLGRIVDETFAAPLCQRPTLLGYRARVRAMVPGYLAWQARTEAQGWRWQAGELAAERPLAAEAAPGLAPLVLHGRIDRVDAQASGARRVLDYKTRDPGALRQELREPGEQVQLLVYHLLLEPAPEEAAYVSLQRPKDPRAPLDGVATLVAAPGALAESAAALESALAVALGSIARGAPLPASGAESVCRRCELRSLCRYGFTAPPAAGAPA